MAVASLTSAEDLECFADLAEFEVGLRHRLRVLQRVVGDSKNSELLSNVLIAGVSAHTQRLVVVFAHLYLSLFSVASRAQIKFFYTIQIA